MKTTFLVSFFLMLTLILVSCGKNTKNARIIIEFDDATKRKIQEMRSLSKFEKEFGLEDPANIGEINCFGVMVTYPELPPINSCTVDQGPVVTVRPDAGQGRLVDLVNGVQIKMPVKYGLNRTIQLIGFKSLIDCPTMPADFSSLEASMSKPFILGQLDGVEIFPGDNVTTMTASYSLGSTTRLTDCKGPMFGDMPPPFFLCAGNPNCYVWLTTRVTPLTSVIGESVYPIPIACTGSIVGGDHVGCWQDLKGAASFKATETASQPLYTIDVGSVIDRDMITFDGDDYLYSPIGAGLFSQEGTVIVVFTSTMTPSNDVLIGATNTSTQTITLGLSSTRQVRAFIGGATAISTSTTFSSTDTPNIAYMSYKLGVPGVGVVQVCLNENCLTNNSSDFSHPEYGSRPFFVGALNYHGIASNFARARIGEVLIYNKFLFPSERDKAISILKTAWGI
jgi:hypothetical protein